MPEIAEVETFKRQLEDVLLESEIESFISFHPRSTRRHISSDEIADQVVGTKVVCLVRHGKYLAFELSSGAFLNVHLRMSGRFLVYEKSSYNETQNPRHSHIVITTKDHVVVFVDPRTFGEMWLTEELTSEMTRGMDAQLASREVLTKCFTGVGESRRKIKTILLDQNIVSGIGNIYADEICAHALLCPTRTMNTLTAQEISKLVVSIKKIVRQAIEYRGSSLRDESFRDLYGEIGSAQDHHIVHARQSCGRCSGSIITTKISGRTTYFCANCQH